MAIIAVTILHSNCFNSDLSGHSGGFDIFLGYNCSNSDGGNLNTKIDLAGKVDNLAGNYFVGLFFMNSLAKILHYRNGIASNWIGRTSSGIFTIGGEKRRIGEITDANSSFEGRETRPRGRDGRHGEKTSQGEERIRKNHQV